MALNFGQRMTQYRREQEKRRREHETKLYERLAQAKKVAFEHATWEFAGEDWLQVAVRTIQAQGFDAELRFKDGKLHLWAVQRKAA